MPQSMDEIARVRRSKEAARAAYDRMSRWYDFLSAGSERRLTCLGLQKLDAQAGERILEIGFGSGHALMELAQAVGEGGKVHGIDISEGMRRVAVGRLRAHGLSGRAELACGDAARLIHPDDFFDAIFMSFVLELFDTPEIPLVLGECHRTLRRNGRLVIVSLSRRNTAAVRVYEWFHDHFPNIVDCRPIFAGQSVENAGFHIRNAAETRMWGLPVEIVCAQKTGRRECS